MDEDDFHKEWLLSLPRKEQKLFEKNLKAYEKLQWDEPKIYNWETFVPVLGNPLPNEQETYLRNYFLECKEKQKEHFRKYCNHPPNFKLYSELSEDEWEIYLERTNLKSCKKDFYCSKCERGFLITKAVKKD